MRETGKLEAALSLLKRSEAQLQRLSQENDRAGADTTSAATGGSTGEAPGLPDKGRYLSLAGDTCRWKAQEARRRRRRVLQIVVEVSGRAGRRMRVADRRRSGCRS